MTQQGLADTAGVDIKTIYNLESGTRWPIAKTRFAVSAALHWNGDALTAIADDQQHAWPTAPPLPVEHAELSFAFSNDMAARSAPHIAEINGRLAVWARGEWQRRGEAAIGAIPDGETLFPDRPQDARIWDAMIEQGFLGEKYTLLQLVQGVAIKRVQAEDRRQSQGGGGVAAGLMRRLGVIRA